MSALQSGAKGATTVLHKAWRRCIRITLEVLSSFTAPVAYLTRKAGLRTRVVGPFDAHWNTLKVLKLQQLAAASCHVNVCSCGTGSEDALCKLRTLEMCFRS